MLGPYHEIPPSFVINAVPSSPTTAAVNSFTASTELKFLVVKDISIVVQLCPPSSVFSKVPSSPAA